MLWYKSWLDTRWRFVIGLALLMLVACGDVFQYPAVAKFNASAQTIEGGGATGRLLNEALDVQRTYRGFIWWQWFRQNLAQLGILLTVLLGSGGVLSHGAPGTLFTLSLPVSRSRVLAVRAATGLGEVLALALVPSLVIPMLSPAIGQSYSLGDVLAYGVCFFFAGSTFFSLALLLSSAFGDLWRPLLMSCSLAVVLAVGEAVIPPLSRYGIFRVMRGDAYFHGGGLPWLGLLASAAVSGALLYLAARNIARQDF